MGHLENEILVIERLDNLRTEVEAEPIGIQNRAEPPQYLFRLILTVLVDEVVEQQHQHLLDQQLEVLPGHTSRLYNRNHVLRIRVAQLLHQLLNYIVDLRQNLVVVVLKHELHPPQHGLRGR